MNPKSKKPFLVTYSVGGALAAFIGFSLIWTLQDVVVADLSRSPVILPITDDDFPMVIDVDVHTDGWTSYTRNIIRETTATWVASVTDLAGATICRGSGRTNYRPESSGTFYWDIGYFVDADCPHPLPKGALGSVMYIFDIPETKRPMVVDFEVTDVMAEVYGQPRPTITRWPGYDQGNPPPPISNLTGMQSPFIYVPQPVPE